MGSTWYAAVHVITPDVDCVTALVFLTRGSERSGFGYKDMTETMGPIEDRCPPRILDLLSPVEQLGQGEQAAEWAKEWRARCRARRSP